MTRIYAIDMDSHSPLPSLECFQGIGSFVMKTICKTFLIPFILVTILGLTACGNPQPKLKPLNTGDVILAFGDSLTYGTGATLETSYPQNLENITGLKVINAGVPGDETSDALGRIGNEVAQNNARLVIVCLGVNDLIRKRPYNEIKDDLRKIIQVIQQNGAQVVLIGVPELGLSLDVPNFYQELGQEFNVPVNNEIIPLLLKTPQYKSDGVHLNQEGYKVLAETIANFLDRQGAINLSGPGSK
jgi:acyl-CoA thioesterase I